MGEFLFNHFNNKDGKKQHFQRIMLYYFKKSEKKKKATKTHTKRLVQCIEKVLRFIQCIKRGVQFHAGVFSLDDAPQFDSHQTETLMENNKCYTMLSQPTYSKYPNQVSKIICTSLVMFIALMFGFHISQVKKAFLAVFLDDSLRKMFHF